MGVERPEVALTDEQKHLAEANHNLIYAFACKYGLDIDEWYGILAIGFLGGVMSWNPQKGALSTIAYCKMRSAYSHEIRTRNTQKRMAAIVSLDAEMFDGSSKNLHDYCVDTYDCVSDAVLRADLCQLSPLPQKILSMRIAGYSQSEISRATGKSQAHVSRLLKKAAKVITE